MQRSDNVKATPEHPTPEQLLAFSLGHVSGPDLASLAKHIRDCDACCQMLRELPEDAFVARLRDSATPSSTVGVVKLKPSALAPFAVPHELLEHPRYKIGRFLGAGGMGAVYLAEHRMMGRAVALKIIHRGLIDNPRVIERFRQEVQAAARLSHPNIVAAYDADQAGGAHFLVMEFVDGMSLDRIVARNGPLDVANACSFVRQAAKGLQHAFETGMVHRDIKPHNLMLTRKGQVKILDFGLARLASETRATLTTLRMDGHADLTRLGDIMGTPAYMAPEQIASPHDADIRADLYSLGCTLYFLLTGQPPFADDSAVDVLYSQQHHVPRPVSAWRDDVPADLVAILDKMLAKQPADRYQTPAEFVKAITPVLRIKATPAPAPMVHVKEASPRAEAPAARVEHRGFEASCPFCSARIRLLNKAMGVSIPCPHCSCHFTAVPLESDG